jgi:hypothetical protein
VLHSVRVTPAEGAPQYAWKMTLGGPQRRSGRFEEGPDVLFPPGISPNLVIVLGTVLQLRQDLSVGRFGRCNDVVSVPNVGAIVSELLW